MSLESTTTVKSKLALALGPKAPRYWSLLQSFLSATISRTEFDEQIRECVDTSPLVQLHNALIVSIFDPSTHLVAALTPPPDVPKGPPRKRRRLLPYQGPDPDEPITLRSSRLKRWAVGIGRRERDRIRNLKPVALSSKRVPRPEVDEIANERGMRLPSERGAQSFLAVDLRFNWHHLHEASFYKHITDRLNLICAQHNLNSPSKNVASLMSLAFEAKLKSLIMQALAMTTTSHAITSIHPSAPHSLGHRLSASAFDTLFTISPSVLPDRSAAASRLALGENESREDQILSNDDREPSDPRWQILALLRERSAVNELASARK
ncbi:transcriptional regulator of RNA polII, SAGA, subunit-domain-containing protein [Russula emetica]|nr:transcriptional regulator of RNA polII, SAGA, subunit-domain-containing protein [Russula emetica]